MNISSHVLDTSTGFPAGNISLVLYKAVTDVSCGYEEFVWGDILATTVTDSNGRAQFQYSESIGQSGVYKLVFLTQSYFQAKGF